LLHGSIPPVPKPKPAPDREHLFQQVTHLALSEAGALLSASCPSEIGFRLLGCRHDDWDRQFAVLPAGAELLCVSQLLNPSGLGLMLWLCESAEAQRLLLHLLGEEIQLEVLTEMEEEALTEVGNRIINRCLVHHAQLSPLIDGAGPPRLWREAADRLRESLPRPRQHAATTLAELCFDHGGTEGRCWLLWSGEPWMRLQLGQMEEGS
jgi:hypothetical protein